MPRASSIFVMLLVLPAASACRTHMITEYNSESTSLKRVTSPQGSTAYSVGLSGDQSTLRIKKTMIKKETKPGFSHRDVDEATAKRVGSVPYSGAQVSRVVADAPAARAGLKTGDVIESLNGETVRSSAHLTSLLRAHAPPDSEIRLGVRRPPTASGDTAPVLIAFAPEARDQEQQSTETRMLMSPGSETSFTGLALATMPPDLAQEVFGNATPTVIITDVVVGSPAYRAGLRGGDRVLEVDGGPCTSADDLYQEIVRLGRTGDRDRIALEVDGPNGPHSAELEIRDFGGSTRVDVPIVFDLESDARQTEWNVLLILLDYEGRYQKSPDRDTRSSWEFRLLFGLFGLEHTPTSFELTLLWLIKFSSG